MTTPLFILSLLLGLLVAEMRVSRRHEDALRARGAVEPPGDVYAAMAVTYPSAVIAMGLEGALRAYWGRPVDPGFVLSGAMLMLASKALKYWAIGALGTRWTFRVLVLPGVPLVREGPYRYVAHPNYVAVVGELAGTAMMMQAWITGPIALVAFGALLWIRVWIETRALRAT